MFYQHLYFYASGSTEDEHSAGPSDTFDSNPACLPTSKTQGEECNEVDLRNLAWASDMRI